MSKYINAKDLFNQALVEEVDVGIYQEDGSYEGIYTAVLTSDLVKMANEMPSADVRENIHGEWNLQEINEDHEYEWFCSECKERNDVKTNFCPNCGADMRGETNKNQQKGEKQNDK